MLHTRLLSIAGLATALALAAPSLAGADTSSSLTVVGTSDVSDSGLLQNVITPQFHQAYPQFTFKYVGSATGTAIQNAESGNGGPSVLIVHAAALENQFVAGGFSYENQYGHAIFTNDFVLAGPSGDPAGVASNAPNNVAQAFADVATAGAAGKATFITRGGTSTASGTTVEEHALWALVSTNNLAPSSLVLCDVSAADGGGMSPISSKVQATSGQACPDSGTVDSADAPAWYIVNSGANQGANVIATNACNGYASGANTCYVLTDRGTYDYLSSGLDPAGTIPNLTILTRNNSATAPGGADALINYFHAYIINPSAPNEAVNLTAAIDFVNFLTSPAFQSQLSTFLDTFPFPVTTQDPGGAPFKADASPTITASGFPTTTNPANHPITVTGTVTNNEPGYPAIAAGQPVTIDELVGTVPVPVAHGTTTTGGAYSITFTPVFSGSYQVTTGDISQVENPSLSPVYGDILSPGASPAVFMTVAASPTNTTVTLNKASVTKGKLTVTGALGTAPVSAGGTVELFATETATITTKHSKHSERKAIRRELVRVHVARASSKEVGHASIAAGQTTFTIKASLKRGHDYVLQLEFVKTGETTSYSKVSSIAVK